MTDLGSCWVGNVYHGDCWPLADRIPVALAVFAFWLLAMLNFYYRYRVSERMRAVMTGAAPRYPTFWIDQIMTLGITPHPASIITLAVIATLFFGYIVATLLFAGP